LQISIRQHQRQCWHQLLVDQGARIMVRRQRMGTPLWSTCASTSNNKDQHLLRVDKDGGEKAAHGNPSLVSRSACTSTAPAPCQRQGPASARQYNRPAPGPASARQYNQPAPRSSISTTAQGPAPGGKSAPAPVQSTSTRTSISTTAQGPAPGGLRGEGGRWS